MTSQSGGADMADAADATGMVDWNLAVATATRLVRPGPEVTREEARAAVAELHRHAADAEQHVRAFTGMNSPSSAATPVLVVDRPGWVKANVAGFRTIITPLADRMQARRAATPGGAVLGTVGGKVTGVEVGMLLAFLSSKVLGQYETFAPAEVPADLSTLDDEHPVQPGRLLLVAPNIVAVERELDVDPHDFRLWVCLHEETHRTQFTAVPWLRDHIEGEIQTFLAQTDIDPATLLERLREAAGSLGSLPGFGGGGDSDDDGGTGAGGGTGSLMDIVQTPEQREILARLTAVMSLLEGHADVVMDGVGPQVVPSVAEIREKFQQRRAKGTGRLDALLRKALGLDAKMRQYQDGAVFVRAAVDAVGMAGFNRVWTSPNTLPTKEEIHNPAAWVARIHK
ncbi:zinc-dependent metalloprotease [Streptacidiphilus sp. N1-12]|uniref:Zinc-dependent metalloprotease n=2 Tax=Streptacidiphilus alkalitolerans TaxID=3342712 RepID=A0ABV6WFY9_9ACTN